MNFDIRRSGVGGMQDPHPNINKCKQGIFY
jgi:hypothetical protein